MIEDEPEMDGASIRLLNALRSVGIETVGQFLELDRPSLLAIDGIGPSTADEAENLQASISRRRRIN
jgi:hypothetical protein